MHKTVIGRDRTGAVAMLTVIFVAVVLSIVVTGFIRLSVSNQRESVNDDLTTRAFYAAETGIETARKDLADYVAGLKQKSEVESATCGTPVPLGGSNATDLNAAYTCKLVDISPNSYVADLEANGRPVLIPLSTSGNFNNVKVEWHISEGSGTYSLRGNNQLPLENAWGDAPAMLRVQASRINSANPSIDAWRNYNSSGNGPHDISMFFPPRSGAATTVGGSNLFSGLGQDRSFISPRCQTNQSEGSYVCDVTLGISGGPSASWNNFLSVRSLYKDTTIRVTANSGSNPVEFEDVQAVVDVTGRANDIFRRVETRIPLTSASEIEDFAILSRERICKYFDVTDTVSEYTPILQADDENYLCE